MTQLRQTALPACEGAGEYLGQGMSAKEISFPHGPSSVIFHTPSRSCFAGFSPGFATPFKHAWSPLMKKSTRELVLFYNVDVPWDATFRTASISWRRDLGTSRAVGHTTSTLS